MNTWITFQVVQELVRTPGGSDLDRRRQAEWLMRARYLTFRRARPMSDEVASVSSGSPVPADPEHPKLAETVNPPVHREAAGQPDPDSKPRVKESQRVDGPGAHAGQPSTRWETIMRIAGGVA